LITVALSTSIGARAEDVWRALTDPEERLTWDERILGEVTLSRPSRRRDPRRDLPGSSADSIHASGSIHPSGSAATAAHKNQVRWRFIFCGVPMVLQDNVLESEPFSRYASRVSIGSLHFDQTLSLFVENDEKDETGPRTRLGMKLVAHNSIPVIGAIIPRLGVQKIIMEYVDTTLRQVQKHCER
jgi:hypothetical protein